MTFFLTLISGIGWMIVYEECIRLGFKEKTYAMPFWALGLNFAWELIYTVADILYEAHGPLIGMNLAQVVVNAIWVCMDLVILFTYFRYGKKEWADISSQKWFYPWSILGIVCCFMLQGVFIKEFGFIMAAQYSAFLQNLLMSVLFIHMHRIRRGRSGQSLLLAVSKWIGTLAPTILMGVIHYNAMVLVCGILCSVFDILYIAMLLLDKNSN